MGGGEIVIGAIHVLNSIQELKDMSKETHKWNATNFYKGRSAQVLTRTTFSPSHMARFFCVSTQTIRRIVQYGLDEMIAYSDLPDT